MSLESGAPFQEPQRPPAPGPSEQAEAAGLGRLMGNTVITEQLVDFSDTQARTAQLGPDCAQLESCPDILSAADRRDIEKAALALRCK